MSLFYISRTWVEVMKKSEYKLQLEVIRNAPPVKQFIEIIDCPDKIWATSGCTCCWHCPSCGRAGCDNMLGLGSSDIEYVRVKCHLEH